jgi:hypothetical protein
MHCIFDVVVFCSLTAFEVLVIAGKVANESGHKESTIGFRRKM